MYVASRLHLFSSSVARGRDIYSWTTNLSRVTDATEAFQEGRERLGGTRRCAGLQRGDGAAFLLCIHEEEFWVNAEERDDGRLHADATI